MIAAVRQPHERLRAGILGPDGRPFARQRARDMAEYQQPSRKDIRARYDAAQDTAWNQSHWANADHLDADSAHSPDVRRKLVARSRYEASSNGFYDGMLQTHANYLVGTGPKLRMQTGNEKFNQAIEAVWNAWAKAIQLRRKLWCMAHAKVMDGEAFGIVATNPKVRHRVKLDIVLVETEQVQSPFLWYVEPGKVDGIEFDEFGNPETYEVLPEHPGSSGSLSTFVEPERVPAETMLHWFTMRRPGQHRGVPEFASTLNLGAASRRHREATLVAAESAANVSILLKTDQAPDENAELAQPYSTAQLVKGALMALPYQYDMGQVAAEHPNAQYSEFHRANISESGRPKSMPYNLSACDSSNHNFASGKLDYQPYGLQIDLEREDADDLVMDKLFGLFWAEAVLVYDFNAPQDRVPQHVWDWPQSLPADSRAEAIADNFRLRNGSKTLPQFYADQGYDAEEQAQAQADFFGIPVEQYKLRVFDTLYPPTAPPAGQDPASLADQQDQLSQLQEAAQ